MIITDFKYSPFSLNLKIPFHTSSKKITSRDGFIITLQDELKNRSYGECSPLPGFSSESLQDSEKLLNNLKEYFNELTIEEDPDSILNELKRINLTPSIQFALEQALLNLIIQRDSNSRARLFAGTKSEISINAVIGIGQDESIIEEMRWKIENGFSTFKIKVGRENVYDDFLLLKNIRDEFGDEINLRLDANRAWSSDEALEYLCQFQQFNISYIEEPCEFVCSNFRMIEESPIPIALDESLVSIDNAKMLIDECNASYIILKPMILGGFISSLKLIKEAEKKNKKVIISSSFESAIGKSSLVLLAASTNHSLAHGLDTSEFFENDLCNDPYKATGGKILIDINNYPPKMDLASL